MTNCWKAFFAKVVDLYSLIKIFDSNMYIDILGFCLSEMNKIMKNSVILQFANVPKCRLLIALKLIKKI